MSAFSRTVEKEMRMRKIRSIARLAALAKMDRRCLWAALKVSAHPRIDTLAKVARGLGMSSDDLLAKITGGK